MKRFDFRYFCYRTVFFIYLQREKANIPNNLQLQGQVAEAEAFSPQSEQSRIVAPTASELNCAADEVMRNDMTSVNT
jgi:hypothetical protein